MPVAKNLLDQTSQDDSKHLVLKQIKKAFNRHPKVFQKYIMDSDIVSRIAATEIQDVFLAGGVNKLVQSLT